MSDHYTIGIVGVGLYGVAVAKTCLELYPGVDLVIFEANASLGGTWSKQRIYPELLTNSTFDTYEYSDLAVKETVDNEIEKRRNATFIRGAEVHHYLDTYAQKHHLHEHIQYNCRVTSIEKQDKRWQLHLQKLEGAPQLVSVEKLILATGVLVTPSFSNNLAVDASFNIPQYHSQDLAQVKVKEAGQHILVVGAGKSALDAAYSMVKLGARVTLVIREEDTPGSPGPPWFLPARILFDTTDTDKAFYSRFSSFFSPNVWSLDTWSHYLLHQTILGRWFVKGWWKFLERYVRWLIGYDSNTYLKEFFPKHGLFWMGTNVAIVTHDDFLDMVKDQRICLKRENIKTLVGTNTVCFTDGSELNVDVIIWATGWNQSALLPNMISSQSHSRTKEEWIEMERDAEHYLFKECPSFKESPVPLLPLPSAQPLSEVLYLYRRLVPVDYLEDHSIVCVGSFLAFGTAMIAEVQALWAVVYLMDEGKSLPVNRERKEIEWDIALTNTWMRRRYPLAERHLNYTADFLQYIDLLLNDLGLKTRRKSTWLKEILEPYMPRDYKGLVQEWMNLRKDDRHHEQKEE